LEQKEGEEKLERQKKELVEAAKRLDRLIYGKKCEKKALEAVLNSKSNISPPGRLRCGIEELEFKIATEAYTLEHEKELLKRMEQKKKELKEAVEVARQRARCRRLEQEIEEAEGQRKEVEGKIADVKIALVRLRRGLERERFRQEREKIRMERQEAEKKEVARYLGAVEEGVELGQIAVIKRKKEDATEWSAGRESTDGGELAMKKRKEYVAGRDGA